MTQDGVPAGRPPLEPQRSQLAVSVDPTELQGQSGPRHTACQPCRAAANISWYDSRPENRLLSSAAPTRPTVSATPARLGSPGAPGPEGSLRAFVRRGVTSRQIHDDVTGPLRRRRASSGSERAQPTGALPAAADVKQTAETEKPPLSVPTLL